MGWWGTDGVAGRVHLWVQANVPGIESGLSCLDVCSAHSCARGTLPSSVAALAHGATDMHGSAHRTLRGRCAQHDVAALRFLREQPLQQLNASLCQALPLCTMAAAQS